jgi:hypothetical protein
MELSYILLSLLLLLGFGSRPSTEYTEARELYTNESYSAAYDKAGKLAKSGDADAMNLIGEMYFSGNGVKKSLRHSIKMFNKAAANGSDAAKTNLDIVKDKYNELLKGTNNKYTQQRLIAWLTTVDSEYKDKMMFDGKLFNFPMPSKFSNAYPYDRNDHPELPPGTEPLKSISYVLKDDLDNYINGKPSDFLYQLALYSGQNIKLNTLSSAPIVKDVEAGLLNFVIDSFDEHSIDKSIKPKELYSEQIINKDNVVAHFAKADGFKVAYATFIIKDRLFAMMLANADTSQDRPVKEDLIEWVNLILEANK